METALATAIIGTAVVSMMGLLGALSQQNRTASSVTTAMYLAQNIQEAMADLPFNDPSGAGFGREESTVVSTWNDVDDWHNYTSWPGSPIDATRQPLATLAKYSQNVTVTEVSPSNLSLALPGADCKKVRVQINYHEDANDPGRQVYVLEFLRTR